MQSFLAGLPRRRLRGGSAGIALAVLYAACAPSSSNDDPPRDGFVHDIGGPAVPWTHADFDSPDAPDDRLTFALFADLTGGERPGVFDVAIAQLNLLRPELIVNVGDLVEGDSDDPAVLAGQWEAFDERAARARAPIFYAGGNHDLTGDVLRSVWAERYGPTY